MAMATRTYTVEEWERLTVAERRSIEANTPQPSWEDLTPGTRARGRASARAAAER